MKVDGRGEEGKGEERRELRCKEEWGGEGM